MTPSRPPAARTCPRPPTANDAQLTDDQLLQALSVGDVVLMYGTRKPPPGLAAVADGIAPGGIQPGAGGDRAGRRARRRPGYDRGDRPGVGPHGARPLPHRPDAAVIRPVLARSRRAAAHGGALPSS